MMIFKAVDSKIEKPAYDINLNNIDLAAGHWGSEKEMINFLDTIEGFMYDKDNFNKNITMHCLNLLKENLRIKEIKFYDVPEENKLILLVSTEVRKFKDVDIFKREMNITFKKMKFSFSIIEIIPDDIEKLKNGTATIPENWKLNEKLTGKINLLKHYQ